MTTTQPQGLDKPSSQVPVERFASFYRLYITAIATIAGPTIPLAVAFTNAIPRFSCQASKLGAAALLINLVLVGTVLFFRHSLIHRLFSRKRAHVRLTVALLILSLSLSILAIFAYMYLLDGAIITLQAALPDEPNILDMEVCNSIPGPVLLTLYTMGFAFLQLAFLLMALREYGQDVLGLTELELIGLSRKSRGASRV